MSDADEIKKLQELIGKVWMRARINAFAHREAMNNSRFRESLWYVITISTSLLSMLFMTLSYINNNQSTVSLFFLLLSIIFAFCSLFATIFSNHMRYSITFEEHKFTQNSYMLLAQRTRVAKNPTISKEKLNELYNDLERDFSDIKARGIEPQDKHFKIANKIFQERKDDNISSEALSFNI
ncbi:MAG: hypothetical protein LBG15_04750 [Dysgonamonadaceae bacterium]|jgi:hypothetical protein|nr:hypothetical protein [Dysgonamonadaceae bacterium]